MRNHLTVLVQSNCCLQRSGVCFSHVNFPAAFRPSDCYLQLGRPQFNFVCCSSWHYWWQGCCRADGSVHLLKFSLFLFPRWCSTTRPSGDWQHNKIPFLEEHNRSRRVEGCLEGWTWRKLYLVEDKVRAHTHTHKIKLKLTKWLQLLRISRPFT